MDSIWLKSNLYRSLSAKDNLLYYSHDHLRRSFGAQIDKLILLEPDRTIGCVISCVNSDVFEETWNGLWLTDTAAGKNEYDRDFEMTEKGLLLPMKTADTSVFGFVLFPSLTEPDAFTDTMKNALCSFAALLYNEAMGSIIRSYHPAVFQVRGLEVTYGGTVRAVKNASFDICKNEFTVILGSSGCGKTTTVNVLGGMLSPTGGSVYWEGKDLARMKRSERSAYRRNVVGFVFQQYNLISAMTAEENIAIASSLVKDPLPVDEALKMVGMEDKAKKYPAQMSGGEQQRVCIARALAKRSSVLICDEPTGALDPVNSKNIITLLQDLVSECGISVIMITHNTAFSVLADHCLLMSDGMIAEDIRQPFPIPARSVILK